MKDILLINKKITLEFGKEPMGRSMQETGTKINEKDMELTMMEMVTFTMRESGQKI